MKAVICAIILLTTFQTSARVIYGLDNRKDIRDEKSAALLEIASSTAAMIPEDIANYYTDRYVDYNINEIFQLKNTHNVCSTERFATQSSLAKCSGFLIGKKTLVTAGHCVKPVIGCGNNVWVFDFKLDTPGVDYPLLESKNIYKCSKIIRTIFDPETRLDYAVVELDREVKGRRPLAFRKTGKIKKNTPLIVIGHPSGLPTKIADGARVMKTKGAFFMTNLDTYAGNSGSAVLNANTLEVEGILVAGTLDYVSHPLRACKVSNLIKKDKPTERVTLITKVIEISKY